jgi:hydrogenase maturation protease
MSEVPVPETVVIGVGNPLMGDDGLGIAVLELLRNGWHFEPHLELLDGGTWGLNLLPQVESAKRVLFIDAINIDGEPGSLVELEREDIPRFLARKLSPHQIDVKEVLALAELRGTLPEELVAVGLQPDSVEMRTSLSPVLESRLGDVVARVIERLERWGYVVTEVEGDAFA